MSDCLPNAMKGVDFRAKQQEFSSYIKDPFNNPAPSDVKAERLDVYRELFFNNVSGFLSSNFPVLKAILSDEQWFELSQDFFAHHSSESPYFSEIPEEFLAYLQNERNNPDDYPFMLELAHYEWVEMALSIAKDHLPASIEYTENLLQQQLMLSPLAWPLAYQYPVQQISPDFLPTEAPEQATYLIVYRDGEDEVNFIQTTAITFRLLQILEEKPNILAIDCLQQIAKEMSHPEPDILINSGLEIIENLAIKHIVIITC